MRKKWNSKTGEQNCNIFEPGNGESAAISVANHIRRTTHYNLAEANIWRADIVKRIVQAQF